MRLLSRTTLLSVLSLLAAAPLAGQRVTGVVLDSVSGLGVPGAVIAAFDSAGQPGVRTISDEFGKFSVDVPEGPGRLRVIRIGFQPRTVSIPASAERRARRLEIRMLSLPALLTRVHVSDRAICPGSDDQSGALALWEQARAGLLAAVVARQARPGNMSVLEFVSDEDPGSRLVLKQSTRVTSGTTARPFVASREAGEFARQGYMARDGSSLTFFAPDADILLDEKFATTHCFGIVRDAQHPGQVGLSFEPSPGGRPDGFVDVDGTLWIESDQPALRTLDFAYTGLDPAYREVGTGGTLVFRTMTNGLVYIERWHMELPAMAASTTPRQRLPGRRAGAILPMAGGLQDTHVVQWRETGGEVLSAHWADGSHAESSLGVVTGNVRDPDGRPLAGVRVRLDGTQSVAETDGTGRFVLSPVLPGRYGLDMVDSAYAPFIDPRRARQTIAVSRDTLRVGTTAMRARTRAVARLCDDVSATPPQSAVVLGTVTAASGRLAPGTNLAVSWTYVESGNSTPQTSGTIEVTPSHDGRFIVCRVPFGAKLHLSLARGDTVLADTSAIVPRQPVEELRWMVDARFGRGGASRDQAELLQATDRGRIPRHGGERAPEESCRLIQSALCRFGDSVARDRLGIVR